MVTKTKLDPKSPIILRSHRLMDAFSKSDDERDFYLDRQEGFIIFVDLDKSLDELNSLKKELTLHHDRYCKIPKLTYYETKKIMEGFVNEKVYDIDIKEKLLDIIQSKEAKENFLEFIYDHHSELEKWQQFYHERSRIRIIEWLRQNHFSFVFEEDLELPKNIIDKLKRNMFQTKVGSDVVSGRKALLSKAKSYYSTEALNPRPKRGRPPKQITKQEMEQPLTADVYTTVPPAARPFLFVPSPLQSASAAFFSKFGSEEGLLASRRQHTIDLIDSQSDNFNDKLSALRNLSSKWAQEPTQNEYGQLQQNSSDDFEEEEFDDEDEEALDGDEDYFSEYDENDEDEDEDLDFQVSKGSSKSKKSLSKKNITLKGHQSKSISKKPQKRPITNNKSKGNSKISTPNKKKVTKPTTKKVSNTKKKNNKHPTPMPTPKRRAR